MKFTIFLVHSIDKSKFSALTENDIDKIIPEEFGINVINDFKTKYKLNLLQNFRDYGTENESVEKTLDISSSTSFSESNEMVHSIVKPRNALEVLNNSTSVVNIENKNNDFQGKHFLSFLLGENESFETENIENEVPYCISDIEHFMNLEESYSQSNFSSFYFNKINTTNECMTF